MSFNSIMWTTFVKQLMANLIVPINIDTRAIYINGLRYHNEAQRKSVTHCIIQINRRRCPWLGYRR